MKPYIIIELIDGKLGAVRSTKSYKKALKMATETAMYNHGDQSDEAREAIKAELFKEGNWCDITGNIWVHIKQLD